MPTMQCPDCYGSGSWSETMLGQVYGCDRCNGSGRVECQPGEEDKPRTLQDYAQAYPYPMTVPVDWDAFAGAVGQMFRVALKAEQEAVLRILTEPR